MIATERREAILRELRLRGSLGVAEFAARVGASPITVRRDLAELERAGRLTRVHGGATTVKPADERTEPALDPTTRQLAATFGVSPRTPADPSVVATIGMIVPSRHYYFAALIEGAQSAARLAGVRLMLGISEYNEGEEVRMFQRMLALGLDGILVTPSRPDLAESPLRPLIESADIPITVVERVWEFPTARHIVHAVRSDHRAGGELAARHLAGLGHRRLALWTGDNPHVDQITAGFRAAAAEAGCEVIALGSAPADSDGEAVDPMAGAHRHLTEALDAGVTGLLVHPDELAMRIVQAALERGVAVPGTLSVVAYDDEVAALGELPLTAVSPPKHALGFSAVDACLRAIAHAAPAVEDFPAQRVRLLPTLHARATTGPVGDART